MKLHEISIKEATAHELTQVLSVEREAFNAEDEAMLVKDLLTDPTAQPVLSLLAYDDAKAVGHILFTKAQLETQPEINAYLLAPLAVIPKYQKKGIGKLLINKGFELLANKGVQLVFVLGHEAYYPKLGFLPNAGLHGFKAPYPIAPKNADAWMVKYLAENLIFLKDKIVCAAAISKPEYWVE